MADATPRDETPFRLLIETGLHAGVVQDLSEGAYHVGSGLEADLVLKEADLAPVHVLVELAEGLVRVTPLAEGVQLDDVPLVRSDGLVRRLPVTLSIGSLRLRWSMAGAEVASAPGASPIETSSPLGPLLGRAGIFGGDGSPPQVSGSVIIRLLGAVRLPAKALRWALLLPVAVGALALASPLRPDAPGAISAAPSAGRWPSKADVPLGTSLSSQPVRTEAERSASAKPFARATLPPEEAKPVQIASASDPVGFKAQARNEWPAPSPADEAAAALRQELSRRKLDSLSVLPGTGSVAVSGVLAPTDKPRWQAVHQWFDEHYDGAVTLLPSLDVVAPKPVNPPQLEAVWAGRDPYVIMRGERFTEGASLEGGWLIERITAERVLLRRAGQTISVQM